MKEKPSVSRRDFLFTLGLLGSSVVVGTALYKTIEGVEKLLNPQPPSDVELPPSQGELQTNTPESTIEVESTSEDLNIDEEAVIESEIEHVPESSPTPEERHFNPETDTRLQNIDLTRPFIMDIPHETGHAGGWGSLRYNIIPWITLGRSWSDPENDEAIWAYENFSNGIDDAIVVPTQQEGSFILMLHSYSVGGNLLSGDVWRNAVKNHLDSESDREIIGKSMSFVQDYSQNRLDITAFNASLVSADTFARSFVSGSENYPMTCDVESMGVLGSRPGQIHFIACQGSYNNRTENRYILSWHSSDLAAIFGSWLPQTV